MTKLQKFIPQTPDPYLKQSNQLGAVKFGHLNALVDAINATIYGDYLQLAGDGPMSTTLRALEDPEGNIANLYLATDKTAISGSLKIGNSDANTGSAILQIDSTSQGVLFPRMTIAERDAIVSPAIGLLIYNTEDLILNQWNGTEWTEVGGGGGLGLLDDALMTDTLTQIVDKDNTPSVLRISTTDVTNYGGGDIDTNTAFGKNALVANTTGSGNVALGLQSIFSNTIGGNNVGIGFSALLANTEGVGNIGVGTNALNANATGDYNTVVGTQSAIGITTGSNNVVFGTFAIPTLNGSNNTILGYNTGQGITTGSNNTILGANVAGLSSTLNNNVIIADGAGNQRVVIDGSGNVGLNNGTSGVQATSVIRSLGTDSGIALVPNGTGAITANIPDGTTAGGNVRGINAVDLQMSRTTNTQVASGIYSFIGGGRNNTTDSEYSGIVAGVNNVITSAGRRGFIGGGDSNTISGGFSPNAIIGGTSSVASGGQSIAGGFSSVASGNRSVALGLFGTASGTGAFAMGGTASGVGSVTFGGNSSNSYVFTHGDGASSSLYGSFTKSNGLFPSVIASDGSAQTHSLIARKEDTLISTGATVLSLDGTGTTNLIIQGNNRAWNVKVETIAVVTGISGTVDGVSVGDALMQDDTLLFTRVGGTSSVIGVNNTNIIASTSMGSASMSYSAGVSQELAIAFNAPTFTGGGSVTVRVVSKVSLVEVAW